MAEPRCADCNFRARYDQNPRSILGRIWKFHTRFCPGWKAYMGSLPEEQRKELVQKYGLKA